MRDNSSTRAAAARVSARVRALALSALVIALLADATPARPQQPDIPPPPPDNFAPVTEAEVLAKLPERERAIVEHETDPKDRFLALLDVSDLRLADVGARLDAHTGSVAPSLLLYEAVVRVADQLVRSPSSKAEPRDKRFKQLEKRLGKQLPVLKAIVNDLSYRDSPTGEAVMTTIERVRASALNSALGVDILSPPKE